jgi:hypothetical protein
MWGVSMSPTVSLAIVASTLVMGVVSSLLFGKPREADAT